MSAKTDAALTTEAQAIATATAAGSNTAAIVGGMLQDIIDSKSNILNKTFFTVKISLTSAQILALNTTPQILVPAQGANTYISVLSAAFRLNYNSVAYATNTTTRLGIGSYNPVTTDGTFLNGTTVSFTIVSAIQSQTVTGTPDWVNTPLKISTLTGNPTAGNSTLDIYITYHVLTLD